MSKYDIVKDLNKHLSFFHVEDHTFAPYGNIINGYDFQELQAYMKEKEIPQDQNIYIPSVADMENTSVKERIQTGFYGEMPIQIGYCNGPNATLNGLEYHKGSEINIAVTDMVLLLGKVQDIHDNSYDSTNVEAFFIPKGTAIELYSTTLHFAPCKVNDEGFKTIVILPAGTNEPLKQDILKRTQEDKLLFMKNKWLLAHPERKQLVNKGAYAGIRGDNISIFHEKRTIGS
ncbi:DUF4867 family protein [Peribacillus sp. SI8-4]|uniref:DUF4867 family protein n=1 Tax=Peribacillus sp. SI8-4 TaxID=3048009 RepID=UPI002556AEDA|nr:DUF4867 family protein [Peribacillus sp. SI8-4]